MKRTPESKLMTGSSVSCYTREGEKYLSAVYLRQIQILSAYIGRGKFEILDVGCGNGIIDRQLVRIFPNISITAIDLSKDMIIRARLESLDHADYKRIQYLHRDISKIRKKYDMVISSFVLHHTQDEEDAVFLAKSMKSKLKKEGCLYLFDFYRPTKRIGMKIFLAVFSRINKTLLADGTRSLAAAYNLEELSEILMKSRLEADSFMYWPFAYCQMIIKGSCRAKPIRLSEIPLYKKTRKKDRLLARCSALMNMHYIPHKTI